MPSRKSNISSTTNGAAPGAEESSPATTTTTTTARQARESTGGAAGMSVEDLSLPRTMISRLSKGVLPPNTQIQKDALSALSKSATVFVSFLASTAMENATGAGKKTIQPQDVFVALKDTEFEFMIPRIEAELKKYNTVQCDKRNSYRRKVKADKAATGTVPSATADPSSSAGGAAEAGASAEMDGSAATSPAADGDSASRNDDDRPAKKLRRETGDVGDDDSGGEDEGDDVEDEEMEDDEVEDDEEEGAEDEDERDGVGRDGRGVDIGDEAEEDEEEMIQRQIQRDEALDDVDDESD